MSKFEIDDEKFGFRRDGDTLPRLIEQLRANVRACARVPQGLVRAIHEAVLGDARFRWAALEAAHDEHEATLEGLYQWTLGGIERPLFSEMINKGDR